MKKIIAAIVAFVRREEKSVASIVAHLSDTAEQLVAHKVAKAEEAAKHLAEAARRTEAAEAAKAEAARAEVVQRNIQNLIRG